MSSSSQDAAQLLAMLAHAAGSAAPAAPPASSLRRNEKTRFQKDALIRAFATNPLPGFETRQMLAETLDLTPNAVRTWFQNQRARAKVKQGDLRPSSHAATALPTTDLCSQSATEDKEEAQPTTVVSAASAASSPTEDQVKVMMARLEDAKLEQLKREQAKREQARDEQVKLEQAKLAQAKLEQAAQAAPPPDMFSFLEHALSVKPTSVPDRGTKAPTAHMLSAVQRAAAYSAAMAYQAAMAAGMAEALAFGSGEGAVSAAPAAVAAIASPSQPTLKGRRRRSRAKGAGSFSWKPLGLPATYKRIHDLA